MTAAQIDAALAADRTSPRSATSGTRATAPRWPVRPRHRGGRGAPVGPQWCNADALDLAAGRSCREGPGADPASCGPRRPSRLRTGGSGSSTRSSRCAATTRRRGCVAAASRVATRRGCASSSRRSRSSGWRVTRGPRWRGCGRRRAGPGLRAAAAGGRIDLGGADLSAAYVSATRTSATRTSAPRGPQRRGPQRRGPPRRVPPRRGPPRDRRVPRRRADLGAYLRDADLSGADLRRGAYLRDADLSGADPQRRVPPHALRWSSDPPVTGWTLRNGVLAREVLP